MEIKCHGRLFKCRECGWRRYGADVWKCPECGADLHCAKRAVKGYRFCGDHGGPNPSRGFYGKGHIVTDGSSSQFPLTRLASKYHQMVNDGRVLTNRQTIDLVDARLVQLLERVDAGEAPERMKRLYELWREYEDQLNSGASGEASLTRIKIANEFEKVYHDYAAWEQIFSAVDLRRKQVESEVKVLTQIKAIITAEDAYELTAKLLAATMRVLNDDPKKLKQVQYEFQRIVGDVGDDVAKILDSDDGSGGGEDRGAKGPGNVD